MSAIIRTLVITLCINLMIIICSLYGTDMNLGGSDLLYKFFDVDASNNKINITSQFAGTIPQKTEEGFIAGIVATFVDGLRMIWNFLYFLLLIVVYPVVWGYTLGFPIYIQLLLGINTSLVIICAIVLAVRGLPT